jgi:hypothetical protein
MESTVMSSGDVAAIAGVPASSSGDVRKRWLVLAVALVVGLGGAFALGSAVKKSSSTAAPTGSLAQPISQSAQHASVAGLSGAGAIPAFKARPVKKKVVKPATSTSTNASSNASVATSTTPQSTFTPTTQQQVTPTPTHQVVTPTPHTTPQGPTVTQGGGG